MQLTNSTEPEQKREKMLWFHDSNWQRKHSNWNLPK